MKQFEERLARLEELGDSMRKTDVPLDTAIAAFEEGIKLARSLEKDLDSLEKRVEILMNAPSDTGSKKVELELFNQEDQD